MNELCAAFDLPGKIGVDGSMVEGMFYDNKLSEIRDYCETDVINTYLLYLIYQHHTGSLSKDSLAKCRDELRKYLDEKSKEKNNFREFLNEWKK